MASLVRNHARRRCRAIGRSRRISRSQRNAARGFTLVEVVCVMTILSILGAIALPRWSAFMANRQADGAARRITADLSLAQRTARTTSASRTVHFDLVGNKYQLIGINDPSHPNLNYFTDLTESPYHATIVSADFGGDADLVFDGFGTPDTTGSVVIQVGYQRRTISIGNGVSITKKPFVAEISETPQGWEPPQIE